MAMSRVSCYLGTKTDGISMCPRILCNIDCEGLESGCTYAHPPKGKKKTICRFHWVGCQDKRCNKLHKKIKHAYQDGDFIAYKGTNRIVSKEKYNNIKEELQDYDALQKKYESSRNTNDEFLLKAIYLEDSIKSLITDIKIKDERIKQLEESITSYEFNDSSKKRRIEVESSQNTYNQESMNSYDDFYQNEIKQKNQQIIDLTTRIDKLLIDNRFMAERLGWDPTE